MIMSNHNLVIHGVKDLVSSFALQLILLPMPVMRYSSPAPFVAQQSVKVVFILQLLAMINT